MQVIITVHDGALRHDVMSVAGHKRLCNPSETIYKDEPTSRPGSLNLEQCQYQPNTEKVDLILTICLFFQPTHLEALEQR